MSLKAIGEALGLDVTDPEVRRACNLAYEDFNRLCELIWHRQQSGLSQADVAAKMGVSVAKVRHFESMDMDPRLSFVRRYADAIGREEGE